MPKKHLIKWTAPARFDLFEIIEYIALDNRNDAQKILNKMQDAAAKLAVFPQRGRIVPELAKYGYSLYRETLVLPWRIIYKIAGNIVYVLTVLDSRRNVEDIILKRIVLRTYSNLS